MGRAGIHLAAAALFLEGVGGVAEGAGGIHHVIHQDGDLARHVADDVHHLADVGLGAALIDNGDGRLDALGKFAGTGHRAQIRGDDHHILQLILEFFRKIV